MRIDELITATRLAGRIDDGDADYTAARIRQELTDAQHAVFGHAIVQARAGAWLKTLEVTTTAGRTRYRLPYRACAGIGETIEIDNTTGIAYEIHGDQIVFESAPQAGSTLSFLYYLRPSLLTEEQTAGLISAKSASNYTVTVNSVPVNRVTGATVATGDLVDIVHSNGWHELAVTNVACSISGTTITLPTGTEMNDIETGIAGIGSYVRAAGQSDWPCLPDDFHRPLASITAARINRARGNFKRADEIEREFYGTKDEPGDFARFKDVLIPRMKGAPPICKPRYGVVHGGPVLRINTSTS